MLILLFSTVCVGLYLSNITQFFHRAFFYRPVSRFQGRLVEDIAWTRIGGRGRYSCLFIGTPLTTASHSQWKNISSRLLRRYGLRLHRVEPAEPLKIYNFFGADISRTLVVVYDCQDGQRGVVVCRKTLDSSLRFLSVRIVLTPYMPVTSHLMTGGSFYFSNCGPLIVRSSPLPSLFLSPASAFQLLGAGPAADPGPLYFRRSDPLQLPPSTSASWRRHWK